MSHSWSMTVRWLRALWREPAWIFVTLLQPIVWLLLFGALFKRIVDIPGFAADSYIDFLAPGIVIMTTVFSAGWSGMGFIEDMNRGVMDRFLTSPVRRVALIAGPVAQNAITIAIQSLIIVGLALAVGAEFPGGVLGRLGLLAAVAALCVWFATRAFRNYQKSM